MITEMTGSFGSATGTGGAWPAGVACGDQASALLGVEGAQDLEVGDGHRDTARVMSAVLRGPLGGPDR